MTKHTHIIGGLALMSVLACPIVESPDFIPACIITGVGSLIPDIDTPDSTLGRKIPLFSTLFKHRGFTHSLVFMFLMVILIGMLNETFNTSLFWYLEIGIASHIVLDMMNRNSVQLFYPFDKRITIPGINIKARSLGEMGVWVLLLTVFITRVNM